jgi:dTDP-D-glucose 4,6-dehydratase
MIVLHDRRYAIDATKLACSLRNPDLQNAASQSEKFPRKLENELGWKADENFDTGIVKTIEWYLNKYKIGN